MSVRPEALSLLTEPALLTLNPEGVAYLNRDASRLLPADLQQLRLTAPAASGERWGLLPGVPGAVVRARADRLGYLRFRAPELAAYAFATRPPGTKLVHFELRPVDGCFLLIPAPWGPPPRAQ